MIMDFNCFILNKFFFLRCGGYILALVCVQHYRQRHQKSYFYSRWKMKRKMEETVEKPREKIQKNKHLGDWMGILDWMAGS